jgi:hypothetical protein
MSKEIIVVKGSFSNLSISLNDGMINNLAVITPDDNPLAKAETKMKAALKQFEKDYFNATKPKKT